MYLLPVPLKQIEQKGTFLLSYDSYICVSAFTSPKMARQVELFAGKLEQYLGFPLEITTGEGKAGDIVLCADHQMAGESYHLDTTQEKIYINGEESGLWYGMQTLLQMIRQDGAAVPRVIIDDKSGIPNRGYYFDATRGRIPKLDWLKQLADKMAFYKLNQLQLYIEHSYLFRELTELWRDDTPLTAIEIMELDRYCSERNIELVPSLSSFGHLEKLLSSKSYSHLCEIENSDKIPFSVVGRMQHHTINATDENAIHLIKSMLLEFMGLFSSKQFNICADETFDLGTGRGKEYAEKYGRDRLYINYVKDLAQFIIDNGRRPMFWGDVIVGFPEMIKELPAEMICLNWGYARDQREDETRKLYEAGATQYCCPGCCGWNEFVNAYKDSYNNIRRMCTYAGKYHAIGVLNTDWGDFLHINHPDFSTPGMIYGAAFSWNPDTPPFEEINRQISKLEYGDGSEKLLGIVSEIQDNAAFSWNTVCRFKEIKLGLAWFEKDNREYIAEHLHQMKDVDEKNARLLKIQQELYASGANVEIEKRKAISAFIVAAEGLRLFNEIGKLVSSVEYGLTFDTMPDARALAKALERWFYYYKRLYRSVSKEGELYRIQELVCFYGNWLRDNSK